MGMPIIPDRTQEQALIDILESIALEETGLAHLINAEGEKVQAIAAILEDMNVDDIITFQRSVTKVIKSAIKMQMLLQFKLEDTLYAIFLLLNRLIMNNIATVTGFYDDLQLTDTDVAYYYKLRRAK